jgi:CBS domain containing-hemolysin-like protein
VTTGVLLTLALVGLTVTALSAAAALALSEFPVHELEELCRRRHREKLFGEILDREEQATLGAQSLQVVGTVVFLVAGLLWLTGGSAAGSSPAWLPFAAWVGWGTLVLWGAAVWLPWAICGYWSAPLIFWVWPALLFLGRLFVPIALAARLLEEVFRRLSGLPEEEPDEEEALEDEIRAIVSEGEHDGLLDSEAREMIEGVMELGDIDVADIMTPRSRMDVLQVDMPWPEVLEFVVRAARTRIPVYGRSLDDIRGILYVKDLLPELAMDADQRRPLSELVRPATFVPHTKVVDDLLREFQKSHNHMAIVVDEYHAVTGLITIEDVLEEIVGEIVDEHDQEEQDEIRKLDDRSAEAMATAHVDELNERLGIDLPEDDDYDTISGLVLSRLQRIPKAGKTLRVGNVRITVLAATPRRIDRLRLDILETTEQETA